MNNMFDKSKTVLWRGNNHSHRPNPYTKRT